MTIEFDVDLNDLVIITTALNWIPDDIVKYFGKNEIDKLNHKFITMGRVMSDARDEDVDVTG